MVTMFSKLRRLGTKSCKVQISIELKELNITNECEDITLVCIELRKGHKSITSSSKVWSHAGALSVKFDEQLVLMMTLYKNPSGTYIEKNGKLHLNGHSKEANSAVFLGSADVRLSLLACDTESQLLNFQFINKDGNKIGFLSAMVTSKLIGDGYINDDEASCSSSMSEASAASYSQSKDVRFGSIYHRDYAGKIDPEVSTATTEKLRSNILKIVPSKNAHDDDDIGSSNDGYGTSEIPETTTTQSADSPMIIHFSGKKYRADEFITPRTKLAFSYGAKDEEIADLHRELEQANRRATMAQQEQRNFSAVRIADTRKHEDALNIYSSKIEALETEIETLNHSNQMSILRQIELDNRINTNNVNEESILKKEQEIAEKEEENIQIKKKVETYQLKLKTSMANEISSATEVIRLQALMSTTLQTIETDKFKASDKAIQLVKLNADEVQRLTIELANEREIKAALDLQLRKSTTEIKQLNDEKIKATNNFKEMLIEKENLEIHRAHLLSTISTMSKEAAVSECETIKDLRVQLSINKLSQNNLLLDEIQVLEIEVDRLLDVEVASVKASSTLKDAQKELLDLKKAKNILLKELGSAQNTVTNLKDQLKILSGQKNKQNQAVSTHNSQNDSENHQTQSNDSKLNDCADRNHKIDDLLSTSEDENLNEFEIEKLILEAKEDVLRVKEKRTEFQQYKQSKRFSLAAGNDKEKEKEKEKEISRRKDNGSPLLDSNIFIKTDTIQCKGSFLPLQGANQTLNQGCSNHNIKAPVLIPDLDPSGGLNLNLNLNSPSTDSTYFHFTTHSTTSATSPSTAASTSTSTSTTSATTNGHIVAVDGRHNTNTEKSIFEKRMCSLLKSLGINEHIYTNFLSYNDQSDEKWNDIVRMLSDNERKKIMILRGCLIRFSSKLTPSEIDELEDIGIVLGPRSSPRKVGLNLGSALCFA